MSRSVSQDQDASRRRIGVIGARGQLGRCLVRQIEAADDLALAFALTRDDVDQSDAEGLVSAIPRWLDVPANERPYVVINAAAYTKVDLCETERELAYRTNALAPAEWARQLAERGIRFAHVSTDYVFAGEGGRPYTEDHPTDPRTVYGASKRAGEIAVLAADPEALVIRTSWVFGPGRNFVVAILEQARKRREGGAEAPLRVVDDQHGSPTYAEDLAAALLTLARREGDAWRGGLLHLRGGGETTWFDFAREILDRGGFADVEVEPVSSDAFETAARRPAWSVLDVRRALELGLGLPPWRDALSRYLAGPDRPEVQR